MNLRVRVIVLLDQIAYAIRLKENVSRVMGKNLINC